MLTLTSTSFAAGGPIPARHTCDDQDLSPPLAWTGAPQGTRSFAVLVDDPDAPDPKAPKRVWVHWVLYNLPATVDHLAEGASPGALPPGAREGRNDGGGLGWAGPCPPIGRHRYFHRLVALDAVLPDLGRQAGRAELERASAGHVLATAELMGTYERDGRARR